MTIKTIPQLDAYRINTLHTKVQLLNSKKELMGLQIKNIDIEKDQILKEINLLLDKNGFKNKPISAILTEPEKELPAGTLLKLDGTPYLEGE